VLYAEDRIYFSTYISELGETRNAYKILVGKPERKRPLRRPRHRWEVNIRLNLGEIRVGRCGMDASGSG